MSFSSIVDGYEKFFKKYFEDFAAEHGSDGHAVAVLPGTTIIFIVRDCIP